MPGYEVAIRRPAKSAIVEAVPAGQGGSRPTKPERKHLRCAGLRVEQHVATSDPEVKADRHRHRRQCRGPQKKNSASLSGVSHDKLVASTIAQIPGFIEHPAGGF